MGLDMSCSAPCCFAQPPLLPPTAACLPPLPAAGRATQLTSALVVLELNALVDAMSYDELYEAFGGGCGVGLGGWASGVCVCVCGGGVSGLPLGGRTASSARGCSELLSLCPFLIARFHRTDRLSPRLPHHHPHPPRCRPRPSQGPGPRRD